MPQFPEKWLIPLRLLHDLTQTPPGPSKEGNLLSLEIPMDDQNLYNKEYRMNMEYALQRYLIEKKDFSEYDAQIRVMRDFEAVEAEAKEDNYI